MDRNIVDFEKLKKDKEDKFQISFPAEKEIVALNARVDMYDKDEMVIVGHWNGECWKKFFAMLDEYALEKGMDVWDCRAVMLDKLLGTEFIFDDYGKVTIRTNKIQQAD